MKTVYVIAANDYFMNNTPGFLLAIERDGDIVVPDWNDEGKPTLNGFFDHREEAIAAVKALPFGQFSIVNA